MVHAEGAPTNGPGGGETDFNSFSLEQLQAMIAQASPSALGVYAEKLDGTARRIQTATEALGKCIQALDGVWEGPSAESFRLWAGGLTAAAAGLGDYVAAAGNHVNHVGQQILVAKLRMPRVDPAIVAKANQGPVSVVSQAVTTQAAGGPPPGGVDPIKAQQEAKAQVDAAHREAVAQMRMLASTYRVTAQDLTAMKAPPFPDPVASGLQGLTAIDGPGGGPGGGAQGSSGSSRTAGGTRPGGGQPTSGIYSAPQGSAPHASGTTTGAVPPYAAQSAYVPQSTNLQGSGSLTVPDPTTGAPWVPPTSGGPAPVTSPVGGGPGLGLPGGVPPFPGATPNTTSGGGSGRTGIPGSGPRAAGGGGGTSPRSGNLPGMVPGGAGSPPGPSGRSGGAPGSGGGRGSFTARSETHAPNTPGTGNPGGPGAPGRAAGMPGSPGIAGNSTGSSSAGGSGRRLAASRGGSVGNVAGTPSNRHSPRLRALPVEGGRSATERVGNQDARQPPGQRTPFTGGTRSEQIRRRTPRSEEDDDNIWDGPRRPGVVPPVID